VNGEFRLLEVEKHDLVFRTIRKSDYVLRFDRLATIEGKGDEFAAFYLIGSHMFLFSGIQVYPVDNRDPSCFFAPCQISFVQTLSQSCYSFAALQSIYEGLDFFILERGTETVQYDGIGCRIDELVLLGVGSVKKKCVFYLSVVVRNIFLDY